jgi:hypothetical protein
MSRKIKPVIKGFLSCFLLIVGLIFLNGCANDNLFKKQTFHNANSSAYTYVGRFDFSDKTGPKVWAPGAYIKVDFQGSFCALKIRDENKFYTHYNYIHVVIDDTIIRRIKLSKTENTIVLGKHFSKKKHHLVICKDTESDIGFIQFEGLYCQSISKVKKSAIIEFIGDSITCGNGSDLSRVNCEDGKWFDQHNAFMSYGAILARRLKREWMLSSVSGIGLTRSCCGNELTMPECYQYISFKPSSKKYLVKKEHPDLVCVTLGQNDGLQKKPLYVSSYLKFLTLLRKTHPKTQFVLCTSPMAKEKLRNHLKDCIQQVVRIAKNRGEQKLEMFAYSKTYGKGCLSHPTVEEHLKIAQELFNFIKAKNLIQLN